MRRFLLQMTGEPGSGKSTLAKAIGQATGAIVIDKDIIKSRILDGDREVALPGLPESIAAPLHHAVYFDLAHSFLEQGFNVVIDGAAFYPTIRNRGRDLANSAGATYMIIECLLPDVDVLQQRINAKPLMSSQPRVASLGGYERPGAERLTEPHLVIDTRRPLPEYLNDALAYIRQMTGDRSSEA